MNLFILDEDPVVAASMYCDKHVVKIILEACQMLSTAHLHYGMRSDRIYRSASYVNHPVTSWVRASIANYRWTVEHAYALCHEYRCRYLAEHRHLSMLDYFSTTIPPLPDIGLTPFAQAMPRDLLSLDLDAVSAYRLYYAIYKIHLASWKNNNVPDWFTQLTTRRHTNK